MKMLRLLVVAILLSVISTAVNGKAARPENSVKMKIENRAGKPIDVYWVNTMAGVTKQEYVLQNQKPLRNGTGSNIFSYDTHSFLAEFHNPAEHERTSGVHVVFTKGPEDEDVIFSYDPITMKMSAELKTQRDLLKDKIGETASKCDNFLLSSSGSSIESAKAEWSECMTSYMLDELDHLRESKASIRETRDIISHSLRNYTCADTTRETSAGKETYAFAHKGHKAQVTSLLDKPAAKIWIVDDFVTPEECKILTEHGKPRLQRATVAADDGSSIVSEHRKAQQAAYMMDNEKVSDPLDSLYDRVFAMANHHAGYDLQRAGQEGFTIIQYNPNDQYTPHCDGNCEGSQHKKHGRVATAVMYCIVPELGGATTFTNHDIVVKPKVGSATFFSYKDMKTGKMDDGDTEHSGCPVLQGEKWITTVWMREGVSSHRDHSWVHFDPDGTRMEDMEPEREQETVATEAVDISMQTKENEEVGAGAAYRSNEL